MIYLAAFILMWIGIGAVVGWLWAATTASLGPSTAYAPRSGTVTTTAASASAAGDVVTGMVVAGLLAVAGAVFSLTSGAKVVLAAAGARPADGPELRQLHNIVEALAIGDGIPKPAVYVVDDPAPNAFATGTSPKRAAVTVTTGLLATMNREELEGVLAHELSHIRNYDIRLLLIVSTLIGMAGLLASLVWRSVFFAPRGRDRNGGQLMVVVLAAGVLLGLVAVLFGPLVRLALSRRRESLADVSGVELTRNPAGLISALRKLQAAGQPLARTNHATAALCIDDPLRHHDGWFHHLFDTHPPLPARIAMLERIAQGQTV